MARSTWAKALSWGALLNRTRSSLLALAVCILWSSMARLCLILSSLRCLFDDNNSNLYAFSFSMFSSSVMRASMASLVSGFAGGGCTGLVKYTFGSTPGFRGSGLYVETSLSEASSKLAGSIDGRDMARVGFFSIRAAGLCLG
jgi:hypothetical protein